MLAHDHPGILYECDVYTQDCPVVVCLPVCDPLVQDCPAGDGCYYYSQTLWECAPHFGDAGAYGEDPPPGYEDVGACALPA